MTMVPILHVTDMAAALAFYTGVLDFRQVSAWPSKDAPAYCTLKRGGDELHISTLAGDSPGGRQSVGVRVRGIDRLFAKFKARGLDGSHKPDSPVHQAPFDQTWGTREFYADDPSGNTLRFMQG
jgi:catechol 2,3-dioxygenase-like lactoylglutathione lyase family enzyme